MPPGEKSGHRKVKPHRAARIADSMRREGVPKGAANSSANAAMQREYDRTGKRNPRKTAVDQDEHDSRTGQRKTNLTTKDGANKPSSARRPGRAKQGVKRPRATVAL